MTTGPSENAAQFQILTRGAGIQLNERVSLWRHAKAIA